MEVLARHSVDNRGSAKPVAAEPYPVAYLRWVAVPMGKCSEPPNVVAGAAAWAVEHVSCQLDVVTGHVGAHEALLERLAGDERALIEEASTTLRKARESVPVLFGSRSTRND